MKRFEMPVDFGRSKTEALALISSLESAKEPLELQEIAAHSGYSLPGTRRMLYRIQHEARAVKLVSLDSRK
ncbi:MAG TPA: helix-turn-helix domain-containing protein [Nitrososphaerales archaeon]|nr:helix-turn-helix domain-containing protein [Nitrososphaerales archaeon]